VAVHYPRDIQGLFGEDLFPELAGAGDFLADVRNIRSKAVAQCQPVVDEYKTKGAQFKAFVASGTTYKPAYALCEDAKVAEQQPYRLYVGYDSNAREHHFVDYVVQNAPCDVSIIKSDVTTGSIPRIKWVGMSARSFDVSGAALMKAFAHSKPGDTVVAVHYPMSPFDEEGLSHLYEEHFSAVSHDHLEVLMDSESNRVFEGAGRLAEIYCSKDVTFKNEVRSRTADPHHSLVRDAAADPDSPHTIYVGYSRRQGRDRILPSPQKLYDVAEYIVHHAACNVVIVKETLDEMKRRVEMKRRLELAAKREGAGSSP